MGLPSGGDLHRARGGRLRTIGSATREMQLAGSLQADADAVQLRGHGPCLVQQRMHRTGAELSGVRAQMHAEQCRVLGRGRWRDLFLAG